MLIRNKLIFVFQIFRAWATYLIESGCLHLAHKSQRTITNASKLQPYFIHHTFTSFTSDPIRAVCAAQFTLLYSDSVAG
jgi:hypothetical protein